MSRLVFLNLPVTDVKASKAFFTKLGFTFNEKFEDETTTCMVINDGASYAMLMEQEKFASFAAKPFADPATTTQTIVGISAADRAGVDTLADAALAAGGKEAKPAQDYGFMYGRSFYDLDGNHWEVMWMDEAAVEAGPAEHAEQG
jgi:predicted lactoylglutathione lyase